MSVPFVHLREIGPGFWNLRGHFKVLAGLIDIGTQMSILRLSTGKFLLIDTVVLSAPEKAEIDRLTGNGANIEAVVATHPFHTLAFRGFYKEYPGVPYYGTPRHLRNIPEIPWVGHVQDCDVRTKWSPDVEMRIPAGAEFNAPVPEANNHFSCCFVFHRASHTLHVDDTIMVGEHPGLLQKLAGFRHGDMSFHPSIKGPGLYPTPEAPFLFKEFIQGVIRDWDFDHIAAAHMGCKIGDARPVLQSVLDKAEPLFKKLSERFQQAQKDQVNTPALVVEGNECG